MCLPLKHMVRAIRHGQALRLLLPPRHARECLRRHPRIRTNANGRSPKHERMAMDVSEASEAESPPFPKPRPN